MIRALFSTALCAASLTNNCAQDRACKKTIIIQTCYTLGFFSHHTHPKNIKTYFIRNCFEGAHCRAWRFGSATFLGCQLKYLNSMRNSLPSFFSHGKLYFPKCMVSRLVALNLARFAGHSRKQKWWYNHV